MPEGAKDGRLENTVTKENLTAQFGTIKYTEAGTYKYTITETDDGVKGITYDTTAHNVVVTVVDNHDGTLTATPKYDGGDSLEITNTYSAEGETELEATKSINDWGNAESFTFTLAPVGSAPKPKDETTEEPAESDIENATKETLKAGGGASK